MRGKPDFRAFSCRWRWGRRPILFVDISAITVWGVTKHLTGYVGWDPTLSTVIVAHKGTNPKKL